MTTRSNPWLPTFLLVLAVILSPLFQAAFAQEAAPLVLLLRADGPVSATMAEYLDRGIRAAERQGAEAIIFELNTPGGALDIMNRMVQSIRNSPVPVIVYVSPRGAMAGSAGTLITLAGHVAAMAPETTIGAASPVGGQGEELGESIEAKLKEITMATVRSLAERRPPEAVKLAEETISNARAVSSSEALQVGLIDFIAANPADLLEAVDGFEVILANETRPLNTASAQTQELPYTFIENLLMVLTDPNIVFLLLTIGVQAIFIELSSPGGWFAGFLGAICLLLAVYGLGFLPVNWFGLIFLAVAFVLFLLDLKAPTHGALTAAGIASFIVGALVLFNSTEPPGFPEVSVPLVVTTALVTAGVFAVGVGFALRARREPIHAGQESLVGRRGTLKTDLRPSGQVQVGGELWTALAASGESELNKGDRVEVIAVDGLRLVVKKV